MLWKASIAFTAALIEDSTASRSAAASSWSFKSSADFQTPLQLVDDDPLTTNDELDSVTRSLEGGLIHKQDLPLGVSAALAELVENILLLIGVEENMPCGKEVDLGRFGGVDEEESASTFEIDRPGIANWNAESGREGLANAWPRGFSSDCGLVRYHRRKKSVLGFIYDNNMDIPRSRGLGGRDRRDLEAPLQRGRRECPVNAYHDKAGE
jgi:hypothetical protein